MNFRNICLSWQYVARPTSLYAHLSTAVHVVEPSAAVTIFRSQMLVIQVCNPKTTTNKRFGSTNVFAELNKVGSVLLLLTLV